MSDAKDKIKAHVNDFVTVLSNLVRQAAVEEITEAIKNAAVPTSALRSGPVTQIMNGRSERKVVSRKPGVQAKAPVANSKGEQKRTPELLAQLMERVRTTIKANPGQGVGAIAASLGTSSKELSLLLRRLVDDRKVISQGKKRGTRYFPR
jgi:hypothetical protein